MKSPSPKEPKIAKKQSGGEKGGKMCIGKFNKKISRAIQQDRGCADVTFEKTCGERELGPELGGGRPRKKGVCIEGPREDSKAQNPASKISADRKERKNGTPSIKARQETEQKGGGNCRKQEFSGQVLSSPARGLIKAKINGGGRNEGEKFSILP